MIASMAKRSTSDHQRKTRDAAQTSAPRLVLPLPCGQRPSCLLVALGLRGKLRMREFRAAEEEVALLQKRVVGMKREARVAKARAAKGLQKHRARAAGRVEKAEQRVPEAAAAYAAAFDHLAGARASIMAVFAEIGPAVWKFLRPTVRANPVEAPIVDRADVQSYVCYYACGEVVAWFVAMAFLRPEYGGDESAAALLASDGVAEKADFAQRLVQAIGSEVFDRAYRAAVDYHLHLGCVVPRYAAGLLRATTYWGTVPGILPSASQHVHSRLWWSRVRRELRQSRGPGGADGNAATPVIPAAIEIPVGRARSPIPLPLPKRGATEEAEPSFIVETYHHRRERSPDRKSAKEAFDDVVREYADFFYGKKLTQAASTSARIYRQRSRRHSPVLPEALLGTKLLARLDELNLYR